MANDVSYFKVPGDSTTYSFNDADAENKIGALEDTVADQADSIAANATNIQTNRTAIGTLSSLTTEAHGNLVAAVNEVDSHADANASAISTINTAIGSTALPTTAQTLTGAIAENEDDISQLNSKTASIEDRFGSYLPTGTNIDNLSVDDGGMWLYERVAPRNHTGTFPQTDTYGWLINIRGSSANFGAQIIRSNNLAASSGMIYIRFRVSGTWGAWMKIVATAI